MVRKNTKPWDQTKRNGDAAYSERVQEHKRRMDQIVREEQEQSIRGDVEPEVRK